MTPGGGLAGWSIRHPVGVVMVALAVVVLGVFSLGRLGVDLLPNIIYPEIGVRIVDPGVPGNIMEDRITRQLEEQMAITEDAIGVQSQTTEGRSSVDLSFPYGKNIDVALRDASSRTRAADEVHGAIIASTSTNLAAVLPFLFIGGLVGLLFQELITTISAAIVASLVVAITVVPTLGARVPVGSSGIVRRGVDMVVGGLAHIYAAVLRATLKAPWLVIALFVAGLVWCLPAFTSGKQIMLPDLDDGRVQIEFTADAGTGLDETDRVMSRVEQMLFGRDEVQRVYAQIGGFVFGRSQLEAVLLFPARPGAPAIHLRDVARLELVTTPSTIMRDRQQRIEEVSASIDGGATLGEVNTLVWQRLADLRLPPGYSLYDGGAADTLAEGKSQLHALLALAIFLVLVVMAVQYESLRNPLVILASVPFAAIGVAIAIHALDMPLSMPLWLGMVMLAGIVVNNAIVLVEYVELARARDLAVAQALVEAGRLRLRPILMTTLTTVMGMMPLAAGLGEGSEMLQPLAITIVFGLSFSTLVSLFLVPCVYRLFAARTSRFVAPAEQPGRTTA